MFEVIKIKNGFKVKFIHVSEYVSKSKEGYMTNGEFITNLTASHFLNPLLYILGKDDLFDIEMPSIGIEDLYDEFEFVLFYAKEYEMDQIPFLNELSYCNNFDNISFVSDNSIIIIPCYREKDFSNIRNFLKNADMKQKYSFFKLLQSEMVKMLFEHKRFCLSVHSDKIHYFNVRLDSNPKHYKYSSYKKV